MGSLVWEGSFTFFEGIFMKKLIIFSSFFLIFVACSSAPKRVLLDSSVPKKPDWTKEAKISWKKDKHIFYKGSYTVRGDQRASACVDLAKLDVKEALITEIQEDLKGAIDNASDSIRADAEIILNKSRSAKYDGQISGLRFNSSYWEKYALINHEHKITCYVLASISEGEYRETKRRVLNKITQANPKLKEAITNKQINFFREI